MKSKNKALLADFGMLAAALVWGAAFVVVKNSLANISPHWLLAYRFAIGAAAMVLCFFPRLKKLDLRTAAAGIFAGIFVYLGFLAQTVGVQYTTASKNAILTATYVVFTPFVYWVIRRKKPRLAHLFSALLCFSGVVLLMYRPNLGLTELNKGDLYTILCGFFYAIQIAYLGIASKKHDAILLAVMQIVTCCVLSVAVAFSLDTLPSSLPPRETLYSMLYLGLCSTFFAYLMQTVGQKYTLPSHASIILSLECLFGCVFSVIAFKDVFTPIMWVGAALTFSAVVISERSE